MSIDSGNKKSKIDVVSHIPPTGHLSKTWYDVKKDLLAVYDGTKWVYETDMMFNLIDTKYVIRQYIEKGDYL